MFWLFIALAYITAHFLLYTFILRRSRHFARESVIFLYQFLAFLSLPIVLMTFGPLQAQKFPALIASLSLHGIYSLSFLELWSLSEGSYSLRMLDRLERTGAVGSDTDVSDLEEIGSSKKSGRLESLEKIGLVQRRDGKYVLRPFGRIVSPVLRVLIWIVNLGDKVG